MIFLIEYDRKRGAIVKMETFDSSEQSKARDAQLQLELDLNHQGTEHEVVLLDAASEAALRRTHRRYFESLSELAILPA